MHVPPMPASWLQQKKHVFNLCSAGLFVDMHAGMSAGMCFDTFLQSFPPPLPSICPCVHVCAQASVRVCVRARPCVRLCMRHASGWLDRRLTRRAISKKKRPLLMCYKHPCTRLYVHACSVRVPCVCLERAAEQGALSVSVRHATPPNPRHTVPNYPMICQTLRHNTLSHTMPCNDAPQRATQWCTVTMLLGTGYKRPRRRQADLLALRQ